MDILLKENAGPLPDERRAMFGMMDRFMRAVEEYRVKRADSQSRRDADLETRKRDGEQTLKNLKAGQERDTRNLTEQNQRNEAEIKTRMRRCDDGAKNLIHQAEQDAKNRRDQELRRLNQYKTVNEAKIREYRRRSSDADDLYQQSDAILGLTFRKKSRIARICKNIKEVPAIESIEEAAAALSEQNAERMRDLFQKIQKIHNSLPRRIFFFRKRDAYCRELFRERQRVRKAVIFQEARFLQARERENMATRSRCQEIERACAEESEKIKRERGQKMSLLNQELIDETDKGAKKLRELNEKNRAAYNQQAAKVKDQFDSAVKTWADKLKADDQGFLDQMESEFPRDKMWAWMRVFWRHPKKVENYPYYEKAQMNAQIGEAVIHVARWFDGEMENVMNLLASDRHYSFLFGEDPAKKIIKLPYSISIEEGTSAVFSYPDQEDERIRKLINALGMRLLRSVPACQMRFRLMDAYGTGAFQRLTELDPARLNVPDEPTVKSIVIGDQVSHDGDKIKSQVHEIKIQMESITDGMGRYKSLREFNEDNPLSHRTYQALMMMNFPLELGADTIRGLSAMSEQCRTWGFSMFLAMPDKFYNTRDMRPEILAEIQALFKNILCVRLEGKSARIKNSVFTSERLAEILFYPPPSDDQIYKIKSEIREKSVQASRILIDFSAAKDICPARDQWFSQRSDVSVSVPVGYLDSGLLLRMTFDDNHVHAVVAGNIGSGKTNLLHVLISNTILRYAPDEVEIYLIDFKHGVDFRIYTQFNLPNFKAISVNNEPEFALAILKKLASEIERRSGPIENAKNIDNYNKQRPDKKFSRILLIIDELYVLTREASPETREAILSELDGFAHQSRAFGLHMIVCGQDLCEIQNFSNTFVSQCQTRVALYCGEKEMDSMFDNSGDQNASGSGDESKRLMRSLDATDRGACVLSLSRREKIRRLSIRLI